MNTQRLSEHAAKTYGVTLNADDLNLLQQGYYLEAFYDGYMLNPTVLFVPASAVKQVKISEMYFKFEKLALFKINNLDDLAIALDGFQYHEHQERLIDFLKKELSEDTCTLIEDLNFYMSVEGADRFESEYLYGR